jgi:hypothetical protein
MAVDVETLAMARVEKGMQEMRERTRILRTTLRANWRSLTASQQEQVRWWLEKNHAALMKELAAEEVPPEFEFAPHFVDNRP